MIDLVMFILYAVSAISVVLIVVVFTSLGMTAIAGLINTAVRWLKGLMP